MVRRRVRIMRLTSPRRCPFKGLENRTVFTVDGEKCEPDVCGLPPASRHPPSPSVLYSARAICLPALIAASVGSNPAPPTMAEITNSASGIARPGPPFVAGEFYRQVCAPFRTLRRPVRWPGGKGRPETPDVRPSFAIRASGHILMTRNSLGKPFHDIDSHVPIELVEPKKSRCSTWHTWINAGDPCTAFHGFDDRDIVVEGRSSEQSTSPDGPASCHGSQAEF